MMITPADSAPERPEQMGVSQFSIQAPYYAGEVSPVQVHGDADAGGRDDVAGSVAAAQAAAEARYHEHQGDTYSQGSRIGDVMTLPPSPLDPGVGVTGTTDPSGAYYDPPRNYGG